MNYKKFKEYLEDMDVPDDALVVTTQESYGGLSSTAPIVYVYYNAETNELEIV